MGTPRVPAHAQRCSHGLGVLQVLSRCSIPDPSVSQHSPATQLWGIHADLCLAGSEEHQGGFGPKPPHWGAVLEGQDPTWQQNRNSGNRGLSSPVRLGCGFESSLWNWGISSPRWERSHTLWGKISHQSIVDQLSIYQLIDSWCPISTLSSIHQLSLIDLSIISHQPLNCLSSPGIIYPYTSLWIHTERTTRCFPAPQKAKPPIFPDFPADGFPLWEGKRFLECFVDHSQIHLNPSSWEPQGALGCLR